MLSLVSLLLLTGAARAKVTLVETIPIHGCELKLTPGAVHTWQAQTALISGAEKTLDFTAMYENLLAQDDSGWLDPKDHSLGNKTSTFTESLEGLGLDQSKAVFKALVAAAARGIHIRLLTADRSTWDDSPLVAALKRESAKSAGGTFEMRKFDTAAFYGKGAGTMHTKLFIADAQRTYIGSANLDWASLSQVKEFGVLADSGAVAADAGKAFENFWRGAAIPSKDPHPSTSTFDPEIDAERVVPRWSDIVPAAGRAPNPLAGVDVGSSSPDRPLRLAGNSTAYISAAPPEFRGDGGRAADDAGIVAVINDARATVDLSVMDYHASSMYVDPDPYYWPRFNDAVLQAAYTRGVSVRLLVSWWSHSKCDMLTQLRALQLSADACRKKEKKKKRRGCAGTVAIKVMRIPGWDRTADYWKAKKAARDGKRYEKQPYPANTRVSHGKVVVTDRRVNIGTSNWDWGYMHNKVGVSFNSDDAELRRQLQAAYERDWSSPYAEELDTFVANNESKCS
jgi:phospholipase D3/4